MDGELGCLKGRKKISSNKTSLCLTTTGFLHLIAYILIYAHLEIYLDFSNMCHVRNVTKCRIEFALVPQDFST